MKETLNNSTKLIGTGKLWNSILFLISTATKTTTNKKKNKENKTKNR